MAYMGDRSYATCAPDGSCGCDDILSDDYLDVDEQELNEPTVPLVPWDDLLLKGNA